MARGSFADRVKKAMSDKVPSELTGGLWQRRPYSHIYLDVRNNFIDGKLLESCNVKGNLFDEPISYHGGVASLNSSQAVCINFFKKFFEKEEWEGILLRTLKAVGVTLKSEVIKQAAFEYVPDSAENTNFDFYVVLGNNSHISMEIKYSEPEFGAPQYSKEDPNKYDRKWLEIYKDKVQKCPYLDTEKCISERFYDNYQINRNISYAKEGDMVLFITPRANDDKGICKGREYIDSLKNPMIINIYWEELVDALMKQIANEQELLDYYGAFKKKYIDILQEI